jgi:VanZ family protein
MMPHTHLNTRSVADHVASGLALPLALVYCGLVVYASLYPFASWQFQGVKPWYFVSQPLPQYWSGFDVAINMLGYAPLGFLSGLVLANWVRRPVVLAMVLCCGWSFVMEALQTYLMPRVASNVDWALNTLGASVGATLAWIAEAMGLMRGWQRWREGRFEPGSGAALGLLVVWPLALLCPTPIALGLGHGLGQWMALQTQTLSDNYESLLIALGLLTPLLISYAVTPKWTHRLLAWLLITVSGLGVTTLIHGLSFGPQNAMTWLQQPAQYGLWWGAGTGAALAALNNRLSWLLALISLLLYLALQSTAALDPYFAQTLALWEGGQFIRFYGAIQYLGWLWPYAALILVLTRMTRLLLNTRRN